MFYIALGLIALMIAGAMAPLVMNSTVGIDLLAKRAETTRRLELAADAILARAGAPAGMVGLYAPSADTTSGTYTTLPGLTGVMPTTADGRFMVYCPYAPGSTTLQASPDTHFQLAGGSYQSSSQGGFVVASDAPPAVLTAAGIQPLAILIAPKGQATPRCQDVTLQNGQPFVVGGVVRVVSRSRAALQTQSLETRAFEVFVAVGGAGDGRSEATPMSLAAAADIFFNQRPRSMTIRMADGNYDAATLQRPALLDGNARGSRLSFVSTDGNSTNGSPVLNAGTSTIELQTDLSLRLVAFAPTTDLLISGGTQMQASGVAFGGLSVASGSRAVITGSASMQSATIGGDLAVNGALTYSASAPFRVLPSGTLSFGSAHTSTLTGNYAGGNSTLEIYGRVAISLGTTAQQVAVSNPSEAAIRIFPGGMLSVQGSTLNAQTGASYSAVLVAGGRFEALPGSTVMGSGGALVTSIRGGALSLNGAAHNPGAGAGVSVQVLDPAPLSGSMVLTAGSAGRCFTTYGIGATLWAETTPGSTLAVLPDTVFTDPTPADPVTSLDMQADTNRQAANALRARQRSMFSANWGCA